MSYNPYSAINAIYNLKGQWIDANKSNDTNTKNAVAAKAQTYYSQLRDNGYGDIADQLTTSDYTQAKAINDKYAKMGKTSTRDYLYSLGQSKGMSQSEVDKLIGWDNQTGEVSFGGKKIGTPDTVVDGVSYWSDTSILDNAFNDYVTRSNAVRSKATAVDQENEGLFSKYNQEYEDLKNTNPFETETAKAILAKYDLAGLQGRDNEAASVAGSNGGNIDSYAAANALRQQSSLINKGQMAVLEAHQQKLDHARSLLSDMGVNIDRVYNQDETTKNNEIARKSEIAAVSGYVPTEWSIKNDAFLKNFVDDNGKLKAEYKSTDFQELINNAKANGDNELATKYAILRGLKIFDNFSEYGKYLNRGDVAYIQPQRTADYDLTKQQIDSAERIAKGENDTTLSLADKEATASLNQINAQIQGEKEVIQETAKHTTAEGNNTAEGDNYAAYNVFLSMWPVDETKKRAFIEEFIKPIYEGKEVITPEGLKQLILTNTEEYNIDVDDAQKICQAFGVSTEWLNDYRDRTDADGSVESTGRDGDHGGMVSK